MNIKEFAEKYKIKNEKKIVNWIDSDILPGAYKLDNGEYYISEYSKPPYTSARARKCDAIYTSIVKACDKRKSVCAKLYKLNEDEFNLYIEQLMEKNIIEKRTYDNCDFYYATPNSKLFLDDRKYRNKVLHQVSTTLLSSVVTTIINKI
ncbi:hypothetical protein [Thomasclavelia spiroformis]|uniref:hypothetical protein n=1 Tax=Thomasclavelia spiroformis TaxID=29348 RepID=UPI0039908F21